MLRAIVFDFDGVIANSEPLHFRAFRDVLAENGLTLSETDYYDRYLGFDDVKVFEAVAADHGVEWSDEQRARLGRPEGGTHGGARARHLGAVSGGGSRHPARGRARPSGDRLRRARRGDPARARPRGPHLLVSRHRLRRRHARRPSRRPIRTCVRCRCSRIRSGRSCAPASCVAIEDSRWGIASARAAGLRTVGRDHHLPPQRPGRRRSGHRLDRRTGHGGARSTLRLAPPTRRRFCAILWRKAGR